jgi:glycosyltransferase involved in cell wall biosynthesis
MLPSVSVVIPSYNHERFVAAAVESVLASEGVDQLEVVVVDDGSTDASRERLAAFRGDRRVRVVEQANEGAHAALNRGLELARGELLFILNSDDLFDRQRIAVLAERLAAAPDAALAASWIEVIDSDGRPLGVKRAWYTLPPWPAPSAGPLLSELGDPRLALLETNWIATTSNLAFRSTLVREHGLSFASLRYAHDWDFALAACHIGDIALVEEPLLRYRAHGANTIGEGAAEGRSAMQFEIMWVVARHAIRLISRIADCDSERHRLHEVLLRSAPSFGSFPALDQLLLLRGIDEESPSEYEALIAADHPFRRAAAAG